uniref:Protein SRG1 n=1 Tax=Aegilops tauschii TaxID=37682 RepID=M8C5B6_AEGTA
MASYDQQFKVLEVPPIVQEPPSQYVLPEQDRPAEMPEPIPIIDLSRLSAGSAEELDKLRSALEILAVGHVHGMEPSFLAQAMKVTREFFNLPLEEKHKDILSEYTVRCKAAANLVFRNMAKILNLQEEEHLVNMIGDNSITQAIFNYYPQCPKPDHVLGLKAHTDGSIITVNFADALGISDPASLEALACREALSLAQDLGLQHLQIASDCKHVVNHIRQGVGGSYGSVIREILETGLQLLKNGVWYNVPIVPNALVMNIGDIMEILSNGFFKSLVHRVVTNAEKERLSLVLVYSLDLETELEPVSEMVDDKRPARYMKIKLNDYMEKYHDTYATGTLAIEGVKI